MKLENITIKNFRCFNETGEKISFENGLTTFIGNNGSGKTAIFDALSRMFGVTTRQRNITKSDFYISPMQSELDDKATLSVDAIFYFPKLLSEDYEDRSIPEFFRQMTVSEPNADPKVRIRLEAQWLDDGTPDGTIEQNLYYVRNLDVSFKETDRTSVHPSVRSMIQMIYLPAARDAETQVTSLLKGRLWKAAQWSSDIKKELEDQAEKIQEKFLSERVSQFILEKIENRWSELNAADTDTKPVLRLIDINFEKIIKNITVTFFPNESGTERPINDLSDGQKSLFHIALTAAMLEIEKEIYDKKYDEYIPFDREKMPYVYLTILAIEEPENSLSPFFLSRIIKQAQEIAKLDTAQVLFSSHSPAMLGRIEPEEVRYCRLHKSKYAYVRSLDLPKNNLDAHKYIRLAVKAYPELYFARFVILGEGDSEKLIIPHIAEIFGINLDPSFVPVVPLGGRYVDHFWKLLNSLEIPYATLLDLDKGRQHGGEKIIDNVFEKLQENKEIDITAVKDMELSKKIEILEEHNIFFSYPIDIDFAMMRAFSEVYKKKRQGGREPKNDVEYIEKKKKETLKEGGILIEYDDSTYDDDFRWYPYLFLSARGKPQTHIEALSKMTDDIIKNNTPQELQRLIVCVQEKLAE